MSCMLASTSAPFPASLLSLKWAIILAGGGGGGRTAIQFLHGVTNVS